MHRACLIQSFAAVGSEDHENDAFLGLAPLDESSFLHTCELVGETTLVPSHTFREALLTHLASAEAGETGKNSEVRAREAGAFCDVTPDTAQHIFAHQFEGVPDTEFGAK
jgi:hypothetical protein